jgi:hypothetical protein
MEQQKEKFMTLDQRNSQTPKKPGGHARELNLSKTPHLARIQMQER